MSEMYSEEGDLLIGDMMLSPTLDKSRYIQAAADDINAKLGYLYKLPLVNQAFGALPEYQKLLLKSINNKLASGRLILDVAVGGEQATLHAYGMRLINEATNDLMCIANGDVQLDSERRVTDAESASTMVPSVRNYDEESLLLGFENSVMRGGPLDPGWWSRPGAVN